jgi:Holliday junction resolvase RusA-like endonuclease
MDALDLWIDCVPPKATSQQKGACRTSSGVRFYKKAHVAHAEADLLTLIRSVMPADWRMIEAGPVMLNVLFVWPWRKSEPKKHRTEPLLPMDVAPDCSNIIKMLEDCLTRLGVWRDDGQVAWLRVGKFWGDDPGIRIRVQKATRDHQEVYCG